MEQFIAGLPKVELHLHIEGSLEPELMFELARRNNISIPFASVEDVRKAYDFGNLQDFLDIYYQGMNVLQSEQDYYDLTFAYLEKAASQKVMHTEIFFDPQGHTERGVDFGTVIRGIYRALEEGCRNFGVTSHIIMCFLRHLSENEAFATLEQAKPFREMITGVGLDSSELGHPPSKFSRVFARVREEGFRVTAHAGEEGPAEYVYEALDILKVDRIDHGNRSLEDKDLVRRIIEENLALTVCPLSNVRLRNIKDIRQHPLRSMLKAGIRATINSDDPAYFGGYMNENMLAVAQGTGMAREELAQLTANAIEASFASEGRKEEMRRELRRYCEKHT